MAEETKKTITVSIDRRFPSTCVAVMIFILLLAFACTGFQVVTSLLDAKQEALAIKGKGESKFVDYPFLKQLPPGVAAQVHGVDIPESTITKFVNNMRKNLGLQSQIAWDSWLLEKGYSAEDVRRRLIRYYVNQELMRQAAEEFGVTVSKEELADFRREFLGDPSKLKSLIATLAQEGRTFNDYDTELLMEVQKKKVGAILNEGMKGTDELNKAILETIKNSNQRYAEATSLAEIDDAELVARITKQVENASNEAAFAYYIADKAKNGVYYSKMPDDLPYASAIDTVYVFNELKQQFDKSKIPFPTALVNNLLSNMVGAQITLAEGSQL